MSSTGAFYYEFKFIVFLTVFLLIYRTYLDKIQIKVSIVYHAVIRDVADLPPYPDGFSVVTQCRNCENFEPF